MGLDMFLYKVTYIGANYDFRKITGVCEIEKNEDEIPVTYPIQFNRISEIKELVGYWRKANSIHQWFVDNCQDGIDECQETTVSKSKLVELLDLCKRVREKKTHSLEKGLEPELALPTQAGFFFGSTDYDGWYWEDIDRTIEILSGILNEKGIDNYEVSFIYHSSW